MAGCNEACHCFLEGDTARGLDFDGLGSAEEPYVITTASGATIPRAGTAADRALFETGADDDGLHWYETDTGLVYVYDVALDSWTAVQVQGLETEAVSTTLNQPTTDAQVILSLTLAAGTWAIWAKANIEAAVDAGTGWDSKLRNSTDAEDLDLASMAVSGGEVPAGAASYWRPWSLQDLHSADHSRVVTMTVRRASTNGTQLVKNAKLMALSVPGNRPA